MMKNSQPRNGLSAFSHHAAATLLTAVIMMVLTALPAAYAQDISGELQVEHRVIRILENEGLVPNTVIIKPGTTVIWINYSKDPMEVAFENKAVTVACREPINFYIGDNGSYRSQKMSMGAVASLCFIEKGVYEYQLERSKGEWADVDTKRLKGTVKVY